MDVSGGEESGEGWEEVVEAALDEGKELHMECTVGASKFWRIVQDGNEVVVVFGKIGGKGQERIKETPGEEEAKDHIRKQVASKVAKGYWFVEQGGEGGGDDGGKKRKRSDDGGGKGGKRLSDAEAVAQLERVTGKKAAELGKKGGVSDAAIAELEKKTGRVLPDEYKAMLKVVDGEYLTLNAFPVSFKNTWSETHVPVNGIGGMSDLEGSDEMAEEWGYPPQYAHSLMIIDSDGHNTIALDYTRGPPDNPPVVFLDQVCREDEEWEVTHLCNSFADLVSGLVDASTLED